MIKYEVNIRDVQNNINTIRRRAGVPVWAVIKFDGYGLGLEYMAGLLHDCGIERFAVSEATDVKRLRALGFTSEKILLISQPGCDEEIRLALKNRAIFSVGSRDFGKRLENISAEIGMTAEAHITIDTGMGRFGFLPKDYSIVRSLYQNSVKGGRLKISGIYSHFFNAPFNESSTKKQYRIFTGILERLSADGIDRGMAHICNSPALFKYDTMRLDAVRIGSAILGRICGVNSEEHGLKKIGCLKCGISEIKTLPRGHQVGYGGRCRLRRQSRVAVVCAGHWAGMPGRGLRDRILGRFPSVEINGISAKMLCSSGMGSSMVDVTCIPAAVGDAVCFDISPLKINADIERSYI